jgi:hypothetical protein
MPPFVAVATICTLKGFTCTGVIALATCSKAGVTARPVRASSTVLIHELIDRIAFAGVSEKRSVKPSREKR